jgi:UDP-galactopyranose mutase
VIDERFDMELTSAVAHANPDVHFVFVGPTAKIDPADLPAGDNIHWLGSKDYEDLPTYLSGWDAALMPFALNDSTRYISPTKTPEYLAAGRSVVSTSVPDVVAEYGESGIVHFGDTPRAFGEAIRAALADDPIERLRIADRLLKGRSWDATWDAMDTLIAEARAQREAAATLRQLVPTATPLLPIDRARRS